MLYINNSGKYIEINFNMKIPFLTIIMKYAFHTGLYLSKRKFDEGKDCFLVATLLSCS